MNEKQFMEAKLSVSIADILASVLAVKDVLGNTYTHVDGSTVEITFGKVKTKVDLRDANAGVKIKNAALEVIDDAFIANKMYAKWRKVLDGLSLNDVIAKYADMKALVKSLFLYRGGQGVMKMEAATRLRGTELTAAIDVLALRLHSMYATAPKCMEAQLSESFNPLRAGDWKQFASCLAAISDAGIDSLCAKEDLDWYHDLHELSVEAAERECLMEADASPTQAYGKFILQKAAHVQLRARLVHVGDNDLSVRVFFGHANTVIELDSLGGAVQVTMQEDDLHRIPERLQIKGKIFEGVTADLDDMPAVMAKAQSLGDDLKSKYLMLGSIIGDYAEMYERIGKLVEEINPKG